MINSDGLLREAGGPVQFAVARIEDAVRTADELVMSSTFADAHTFRMPLSGYLTLPASSAE